jgi:hypothetical protein
MFWVNREDTPKFRCTQNKDAHIIHGTPSTKTELRRHHAPDEGALQIAPPAQYGILQRLGAEVQRLEVPLVEWRLQLRKSGEEHQKEQCDDDHHYDSEGSAALPRQ